MERQKVEVPALEVGIDEHVCWLCSPSCSSRALHFTAFTVTCLSAAGETAVQVAAYWSAPSDRLSAV